VNKKPKVLYYLVLLLALGAAVYLAGKSQETRRGAYFAGARVNILPEMITGKVGAVVPVQVWVTSNQIAGSAELAKVSSLDATVCYGDELVLNADTLDEDLQLNTAAFKSVAFKQIQTLPTSVDGTNKCLKMVLITTGIQPASLKSGTFQAATVRFRGAKAGSGKVIINTVTMGGYNPAPGATDMSLEVSEKRGASYTISGTSVTGDVNFYPIDSQNKAVVVGQSVEGFLNFAIGTKKLSGVDFRLKYDKNLLKFESITPILTSGVAGLGANCNSALFGAESDLLDKRVDETNGTINLAGVSMETDDTKFATGNVCLARFKFRALVNGEAVVTLDTNYENMAAGYFPGQADQSIGVGNIVPLRFVIGGGSVPTNTPTVRPTNTPWIQQPTNTPWIRPTNTPIVRPTNTPWIRPTNTPIVRPTNTPWIRPTNTPIVRPTNTPWIQQPTNTPWIQQPTNTPTVRPTNTPWIQQPTNTPWIQQPTNTPTVRPTNTPWTPSPTAQPTTPVCGNDELAGQGVSEIEYEVGMTSGHFTFSWALYALPDKAEVFYEGTKLFEVADDNDDFKEVVLNFGPGTSTKIKVRIAPEDGVTESLWYYKIDCPVAGHVQPTSTPVGPTNTPVRPTATPVPATAGWPILKYMISYRDVISGNMCATDWPVVITAVAQDGTTKVYQGQRPVRDTSISTAMVYRGQLTLTDFPYYEKVAIFFKGPKHLQSKYGVNNQNVYYAYAGGNIVMTDNESATPVYDFSGYPLMPGDVTGETVGAPDGVVDGRDYSFVKAAATRIDEVGDGDYLQADMDGNCKVNGMDTAYFKQTLKDKLEQMY
jgi:hypothetical protein